ncbi:MAG: translation initiation factor IF-2 [Nitrospiraceae bacterium]|nr:MAG: translation initiation factor IF-2 [Nitrospiraceae bacterium]
MRIYELSKKIDISSKEIIARLAGMGIRVKSHMSNIDDDVMGKLSDFFAKKEIPGKEKLPPAPGKEAPVKPAGKPHVEKPRKEQPPAEVMPQKENRAAQETKAGEVEEAVSEAPAVLHKKAGPPVAEEDEVIVPDRFKKEIERSNIAKFKAKPGMQRAFDSIRRVDVAKKPQDFKPHFKKHDKRSHIQRVEPAPPPLTTQPRKRVIKFQEGTSVKEFAELIGQKSNEVIKKFMELGSMPTINQPVDADAAQIVAESFGLKIELANIETEESLLEEAKVEEAALSPRPPIVTIMGHVDHGKTTLLDAIRQTRVTETEAGGITQHIGAYKVKLKNREITFLDTPGHEAFTMMRARGAKVTDIVVLVVAADDSVMPQTIEAIDHAKAANVPIVVAINKIDKPDANVTKVRNELSQYGVVSEEWGGQNIFVEVSAKQKTGIERLLEMILLQAEVMELKANYNRPARGTIVEAKLDRGRGPVGTVLVNAGELKTGDPFLVGTVAGRVRALIDDKGKKIEKAGPSTPVEVIGFPEVPQAGDIFIVMEDERKARQIAINRLQKQRTAAATHMKKLTLDQLYEKVKEGEVRDLNVIIKADVQGSAEAVRDSLSAISHPQVKVNVIHASAGGINESDVMLAAASNAIIIGFNIRPDAKASALVEKEGVDVRLYNIIYEAIEDVKKALEGLLEPTITEKVIGRAEVRSLFHISRIGTVAGCYVTDGKISRSSSGVRVIRDNVVIYESRLSSLKRFKDDAREVQSGFECGIMVENFNDLKVGDILENYVREEVAAKLE